MVVKHHIHDPSVKLQGDYTRDNFTNNAKLWDRYVVPHLKRMLTGRKRQKQKHAPVRPLRVLLIETAEEGMVSEFLGAHSGLRGTRIETLALTDHPESALATNMAKLKCDVTVKTGDVEMAMLPMAYECMTRMAHGRDDSTHWDIVYLEGLHSAVLLRLAALAFTCTVPGGLMVFDDYTYALEHDTSCPRRGIDAFVDSHSQFLKSIGPTAWQAILCKRVRPLRLKGCSSEFYRQE